jgi:hypothetical protein
VTLRGSILAILLSTALILPLTISARRLGHARAQVQAGLALLVHTTDTARRVLDLRERQQRVAERKRPQQDVIARVNSTLAAAELPPDRFGGLRPESDSALPGSAANGSPVYRRQTVRISLNGLSIRHLGGFLREWSDTQWLWTPTRIELTHVRDKGKPDLYDAEILITATYVADQ